MSTISTAPQTTAATTTIGCRQSLIVPTSKMVKISTIIDDNINNNHANDNDDHTTESMKLSTNSNEILLKSEITNKIMKINLSYMSLTSLCLGFLFIWSTIISIIFIEKTLHESRQSNKPLDQFIRQEQMGQILFAIGQEMLFTVESLVSINLNQSNPNELSKSINISWDLTDGRFDAFDWMDDQYSSSKSLNNEEFIDQIELKLQEIRSNISLNNDHPIKIINLYKNLFDFIFDYHQQFQQQQQQMRPQSPLLINNQKSFYNRNDQFIDNLIQMQLIPYKLYLKGMTYRFIELSYGTIYHLGTIKLLNASSSSMVTSNQSINQSTTIEQEISNYFYYFYTSYELIDNSFQFDPHLYEQYSNLINQKQYYSMINIHGKDDITDNNLDHLSNGIEYIKFVTNIIQLLLQLKNVFNENFKDNFLETNLEQHQQQLYYLVILSIYMFILILSTTFLILFVNNIKLIDSTTKNNEKFELKNQSSTSSSTMDKSLLLQQDYHTPNGHETVSSINYYPTLLSNDNQSNYQYYYPYNINYNPTNSNPFSNYYHYNTNYNDNNPDRINTISRNIVM